MIHIRVYLGQQQHPGGKFCRLRVQRAVWTGLSRNIQQETGSCRGRDPYQKSLRQRQWGLGGVPQQTPQTSSKAFKHKHRISPTAYAIHNKTFVCTML